MTNKPSARGFVVAVAMAQLTQFESLRGSTTMYEAFFHLRRRPFLAAPSIDSYFPGQAIEHARQTLTRCIERAQGPGLVIGPAGTGKSLLCQLLADHFRSALRVAMLANSRLCTRRALLQSILFELGQRYRDMDEGELRLSLINYLEPSAECPNGVLLIVDEAHTYPTRLLEELRILTNLVRDGVPRIRLVLAGGSPLEERFAGPKFESFNQRIAGRCYLQALNRDETTQYVRAQLAAVDGDPDRIIADSAWTALYRATDGVPRLINQICDAALLFAAQSGVGAVTDQIVEHAWADLQQIPTPWQTPPLESHSSSSIGAAPSSVIEFGQLNDDFGSIASFEPLADAGSSAHPLSSTELDASSASTARGALAADVKDVDESRADEGFASAPDASIVVVDSWLPDIAVKLPRRSEAPTAARISANGPSSSPASRPANRPVANESNNATQTAPSSATHKPSSVAAVGPIPATGSVPSADQLFGSDYLEEEVVIDRYASLEMMAIAERLKVSCREGREIAASLSSLTTPLARRTTAGGPTTAFTSLAAESRAAFGITGPTDGLRPATEEWLEPAAKSAAWEATSSSPAATAVRVSLEFEPTVAVIGLDATDSPAAAIVAAGQAEIDAESMPVQRDSQVRVAAAATSQAIITGPIDSPHHSQLCNPVVAESESRPAVAPAAFAPAAIVRETAAHEAVAHETVPSVGSSGADVHPSHAGPSGAAVRMRPHVRVAATDDRDLLVVEEDGTTHPPVDPDQGRARRQEYRSLFARLRARS